ncbi:hypothetical protein Nepgr_008236 [Nepenthes gracilis]|uniref:Uncharacterized protein n=1 Tax=Nepenthes gracilis TaxID=150966 RepID=A0AAD3S9D8_NEPGR|nr:hypothetical protein Nepgr_008236 [Nepenthes gracilis]
MKKRVGRQATRRPKSCLEKIKHKKRELGSSSSQLHVASPIEQLQTQQYQPPMTYTQLLVGQQLHTPLCGPAHAKGPTAREPDDLENATALQGQLRENHMSICFKKPIQPPVTTAQQQAIDEPRELPSSSAAASDADLKLEEPEIWVEVLNYHLWWISRLFAANVDSSFFMQIAELFTKSNYFILSLSLDMLNCGCFRGYSIRNSLVRNPNDLSRNWWSSQNTSQISEPTAKSSLPPSAAVASKDGTVVEITTLSCEVENTKQEAKAVAAQLHGGVGLHNFGAWLPSMTEGEARVTAEQACFLPCTDDGIPIIGEIPGVKGCFVGTGQSCWGIPNGPCHHCRLVRAYFGWPGASSRP